MSVQEGEQLDAVIHLNSELKIPSCCALSPLFYKCSYLKIYLVGCFMLKIFRLLLPLVLGSLEMLSFGWTVLGNIGEGKCWEQCIVLLLLGSQAVVQSCLPGVWLYGNWCF